MFQKKFFVRIFLNFLFLGLSLGLFLGLFGNFWSSKPPFAGLFDGPVDGFYINGENKFYQYVNDREIEQKQLPFDEGSHLEKDAYRPVRVGIQFRKKLTNQLLSRRVPSSLKSSKKSGKKSSKKGNTILVALQNRGLYLKDTNQNTDWMQEKGLLKRRVDFDPSALREVTGIDPSGRFLLHKHNILYKGKDHIWYKLRHNLSKSKYFSSVYSAGRYLYIGTSVNGLYRAKIKSTSTPFHFTRFNRGLSFIPHSNTLRFYEEIHSIYESPRGDLWLGTSIQGKLYVKPRGKKTFQNVPFSFHEKDNKEENREISETLDILQITSSVNEERIWVSTSLGLVILTKKNGYYQTRLIEKNKFFSEKYQDGRIIFGQSKKEPSLYFWLKGDANIPDPAKETRIQKASGKRLFYSSPGDWEEKLPSIQDFFRQNFYNGVVVDIKDDYGYIRYHSKIDFVKKIKALRPKFSLRELIETAHQNHQWVVGRIVTFKDPVLFRQPGYAILDKRNNRPWIGIPRERWIDPFNTRLAPDYYIPLARELESLGIDEIQFDYIRFPSDGNVWNTHFSHKKEEDIYPSEAIESFLHSVRNSVSLPISLDIYGYNGLYRAPGVIGQDIEAYGKYADVLAPMLYSSHFGDQYMTRHPKKERTRLLLKHSAIRSNHLAQNNFLVRPWLQAFPMKTNIWGYGKKYFEAQIQGIQEEGQNGFMFWGNIKDMKKVAASVSPSYIQYENTDMNPENE